MSKARLTYRFDDQGNRARGANEGPAEDKVIPLYEEEYRVIGEVRPADRVTRDYGEWESPFDAETRRIEQLIRESGVRPPERREEERPDIAGDPRYRGEPFAASPLRIREDLQPQLPDERLAETGPAGFTAFGHKYDSGLWTESPSWGEPPVTGARYVRRPRTPWLKLIASVAGAVATGAVLGFVVLSLFSRQPSGTAVPAEETLKTEPPGVAADFSPAASAAHAAEVKPGPAAVIAPVSALIPAKSYIFLQTGSFATAQAADAAGASQQKKGIAAVSEKIDKVYLYAGVAANKESAQGLSRKLKNDKIDVYLKSVDLPAVAKSKWNGKPETLAGYLAQTDKLITMIAGVTLVHLEDDGRRPLDDATVQSLKTAFDTWSASAAAAAEGAPADAKLQLQKVNAGLNAAKSSLDAYKKMPTGEGMWQAQAGLLQTVLAEKEFLLLAADK